jgi:hypothetical protein
MAEATAATPVLIVGAGQGGVTALLRDLDSGSAKSLRCRYPVGCDGGHSLVRKKIGVRLIGTPGLWLPGALINGADRRRRGTRRGKSPHGGSRGETRPCPSPSQG